MSCCAGIGADLTGADLDTRARAQLRLAGRRLGNGLVEAQISVPDIHCGGCIHKIETALGKLPEIHAARVNLSTKRIAVRWHESAEPPAVIETLDHIGYRAHLYDPSADAKDIVLPELLRALAVAGFAASNIMLLSVSIWAGAEPQTRDLFHWISAIIALPALAYAGRPFFRSAFASLRCGQTNMDVPISIGVTLAFALSLFETIRHGPHAYFDASVSLLFFLLIGRTLDHVMRERALTAVKGLARLAPQGALVIRPDGSSDYVRLDELVPGVIVAIAAGERIPVDGRVVSGRSEIDCSLVSGESVPQIVAPGTTLQAGMLNLTSPLRIAATATAKESFLAEMVRMMEAAEGSRSSYRRIADRAARLYAPVVHTTALATFAGWMVFTGDAYVAVTTAIAVLIITCPCALGLAVPMVQVMAARRLFERGIMVKDGAAIERLAEIDTVVFDKTGTLSMGSPSLIGPECIDRDALRIAAAIASHSRHPYSLAITAAGRAIGTPAVAFDAIEEHPGSGLEAWIGPTLYRLGRADWAITKYRLPDHAAGIVLAKDGRAEAHFRLKDPLRPDARQAVAELQHNGYAVTIVSGDADAPVRELAVQFGVPAAARVLPAQKLDYVRSLTSAGRHVLMVGDGLNDAPAVTAAHASIAPATAADVSRNAADFVFLRESLLAVPQAVRTAREAGRLVRQNMTIAIIYNLFAVPLAVSGLVTPLVAAVAMSASSIIVVANAARLRGRTWGKRGSDVAAESFTCMSLLGAINR
jgi:Cu2+-exporting ATPase